MKFRRTGSFFAAVDPLIRRPARAPAVDQADLFNGPGIIPVSVDRRHGYFDL
jgi:hypothetical protein